MSRNQIVRGFSGLASTVTPYEFVEFPKWVEPSDGGPKVLCQNAEEEAALIDGEELIDEKAERERLVTIARQHKLQVDGRWSMERIAKVITDAGHDASRNPFL